MSDTVLFIDELESSSVISICRICHEQELESCKSLEAPCACSGTVKFAHRDCIQRWCNEKGNTTCEICLQKFQPGYTAPPKKPQLVNTTSALRGSLVDPTNEPETETSGENLETDHIGCTSATGSGASCGRSLALIFTCVLLIRHLFDVTSGGAQGYPFSLSTVFIVKATGIIVPMCILIRIIAVIHNSIKHHRYQNSGTDSLSSHVEDMEDDQQIDDNA